MSNKTTLQTNIYFNEIILNKVCNHLQQQDLVSSILVCKFWNDVLTPKLYKRILINGSPSNTSTNNSIICCDRRKTKLQFDTVKDSEIFDTWMNFKVPINNLIKLWKSIMNNEKLCKMIEEIEIFDCYKTELRFYILQILQLVIAEPPATAGDGDGDGGKFQNFKCHHTTSNQFYYQCLCYQEFFQILLENRGGHGTGAGTGACTSNSITTTGSGLDLEQENQGTALRPSPGPGPGPMKNLCLNFNDFIKHFLTTPDPLIFQYFEKFEIIINSYELNKLKSGLGHHHTSTTLQNFSNFQNQIHKLVINNNFEYFCSFINLNTTRGLELGPGPGPGLGQGEMLKNLEELNITVNFLNDDVLKFFNTKLNANKLQKLSLIMYDEDENNEGSSDHHQDVVINNDTTRQSIPWKLFDILKKFKKIKELAIKLNHSAGERLNDEDQLLKFVIENFGSNLEKLSILNKFHHEGQLEIILKSLRDNCPNLQYLNLGFQIDFNWISNNITTTTMHDEFGCQICEQYHYAIDSRRLTNILCKELLPLITPKHDYHYLDQDLNLNEYPIGKITNEMILKISKDVNYDIKIDDISIVIQFITHQLEQKILPLLIQNGSCCKIDYLSIAGFPFIREQNKFKCLLIN